VKGLIGWLCGSRTRQALLLVVVCCAVYLPGLGSTGFSMSEGHRVIPAWEMLGDARAGEAHWMVPRMFGTAYLRKPPGVMWAIAGSSAVLGETEFAARLPSAAAATLLVLAVWGFSTRWFGSPWGLGAGRAQARLPVLGPSARSAESESLHVLTTGVACLLVVDWLVRAPRGRGAHWGRAGVLLAAMLAVVLTKGLSGAPFVGGALVGAWIAVGVERGAGLGVGRAVLLPLLVALCAAVVLGRALTQPTLGVEPVVAQGVGDFLWERGALVRIGLLGPTILVTMLPASLALLFPWGPDAARERARGGEERGGPECPARQLGAGPGDIARALAWSGVASLVVLTVLGVSNPRYGLPACALLTPLVAYVARGAGLRGLKGPAPAFLGKRPAIARAMLLGRAWVWPVVLLVGAGVYVGVLEPDRRAGSGREAGIALAAHLPDGAEVWADEMIEARPEVLLYAVREAAREGRRVRVRWLKPGFMPAEHPEGLLLLLREDALVDEVAGFGADGRFGALTEVARGEVHKYTFVLCAPGG